MNCFEICQLIVICINANTEKETSVAPVDNLVITILPEGRGARYMHVSTSLDIISDIDSLQRNCSDTFDHEVLPICVPLLSIVPFHHHRMGRRIWLTESFLVYFGLTAIATLWRKLRMNDICNLCNDLKREDVIVTFVERLRWMNEWIPFVHSFTTWARPFVWSDVLCMEVFTAKLDAFARLHVLAQYNGCMCIHMYTSCKFLFARRKEQHQSRLIAFITCFKLNRLQP